MSSFVLENSLVGPAKFSRSPTARATVVADDLEFSVDTVDCLETDKSQDSSVFLKKLCKQGMDAISLVYCMCWAVPSN